MTITVLAILETEFIPDKSLGRVMNERLHKAAEELKQHLSVFENKGDRSDDLIVYLSYNPKYKIRFRVVNDVAVQIENQVNDICGNLGYIYWKTAVIGLYKNR